MLWLLQCLYCEQCGHTVKKVQCTHNCQNYNNASARKCPKSRKYTGWRHCPLRSRHVRLWLKNREAEVMLYAVYTISSHHITCKLIKYHTGIKYHRSHRLVDTIKKLLQVQSFVTPGGNGRSKMIGLLTGL